MTYQNGTIDVFSTKTGGIKLKEEPDKWYNADRAYKATVCNMNLSPGQKVDLLLNDEGYVVQVQLPDGEKPAPTKEDTGESIKKQVSLKCATEFLSRTSAGNVLLPKDIAEFAKKLHEEYWK